MSGGIRALIGPFESWQSETRDAAKCRRSLPLARMAKDIRGRSAFLQPGNTALRDWCSDRNGHSAVADEVNRFSRKIFD